jgi:beta-aspartyl-dipeptidase (metallo-type)
MGGMVDISTGGTKYTEPYKSLLYGLEKGGSIDYFSFSSDGNAGLDRKNEKGELIGFRKAPFDLNIEQAVMLGEGWRALHYRCLQARHDQSCS